MLKLNYLNTVAFLSLFTALGAFCYPHSVFAKSPSSDGVTPDSFLFHPHLPNPKHPSSFEKASSKEIVSQESTSDRNLGLQAQTDNLGTDFNSEDEDITTSGEGVDSKSQSSDDPVPQDRVLTEEEIQEIQESLQEVQTEVEKQSRRGRSSPGITISNPAGFGADNFTAFANLNFQERVRRAPDSDATAGFGIGFGDSRKNIGVQISYTLASFGQIGRSFGTGGFNAKIHRQFPGRWAIAVGAEGLINLGDGNDFDDTFYGSVSKIIKLRQDVNKPFSRLALTGGAGTGRFRLEEDFVADRSTVSPFGTMAVLVVRPVSTILEWTGQDLAVGLSIAPFKNIPLVISPSIRDILGAGENPRFVLGVGMSWQF